MSYPPSAYGPAYGQPAGYPGQPAADPRSAPYGQAPAQAPPAHDPYAAQYASQYQQQGHSYPPPAAGYEQAPPAGYPPPASYPPPAASYQQPPPQPAYGQPPPDYAQGYSHPPPADAGHYGAAAAPPPVDPRYASHYAYGAPPPGYPPPAYGPPPGYGAPPPAYGYPPVPGPYGYGAPPGYGARDRSPRRSDRDRRRSPPNNRKKGDGKGNKKDQGQNKNKNNNNNNQKEQLSPNEPKGRLTQWLASHPGWMGVWLEGIDPPRRQANTPNVTVAMLANFRITKEGPAEFGFLYSASRAGTKKKDRERECSRDINGYLDQFPIEDMKAWCQMPDGQDKREAVVDDIERLTKAVRAKYPAAVIELPEPSSFVLVAASPWGPHEKAHGAEAELAMLEKFDPGFAELLREARRVAGLVRKQWYVAVVNVKPEAKDGLQAVHLGFGIATDKNIAKARAVHSAELRAQILTEEMFNKNIPQKAIPADAPKE